MNPLRSNGMPLNPDARSTDVEQLVRQLVDVTSSERGVEPNGCMAKVAGQGGRTVAQLMQRAAADHLVTSDEVVSFVKAGFEWNGFNEAQRLGVHLFLQKNGDDFEPTARLGLARFLRGETQV